MQSSERSGFESHNIRSSEIQAILESCRDFSCAEVRLELLQARPRRTVPLSLDSISEERVWLQQRNQNNSLGACKGSLTYR